MSSQVAITEAWLEELVLEECLELLRTNEVGRVGVIVGEFPVVLPVNYKLVESTSRNWVVLRTRPGGVIEQASMYASLQIDGFDADLRRGWSVLVRGILQPVNPDVAGFRERFDLTHGSQRKAMLGSSSKPLQ
jgi:nitroimidazol reductase NimA-like FMN-containing flavoprotein (pyridoxamine 5'-phosphate oxidase superfamily)